MLVLLGISLISIFCQADGVGNRIRRYQLSEKLMEKSGGDQNSNEIGNGTLPVNEIVVEQHRDVRLSCNVNHEVKWSHNGLAVDLGHLYVKEEATGALLISNVRLEDDGVWKCHRSSGAVLFQTKLTVLDRPSNPYLLIDGRRLDPGNLFVPIKENTELRLACVVEGGNPPPHLRWMLIPSSTSNAVGDELELKSDGVVRDNAVTKNEARIAPVLRGHHNSTVLCLSDHVTLSSPENASLLLDVQYSPSFAISREPGFGFPIREGISVSLKCDVDSNPMSNPVWQKDDGLPPVAQSADGFLNFSTIRREHSGWYKCTSHHVLGDFSSIGYFLNVRFDPVIEVTVDPSVSPNKDNRNVEVPLGSSVHLRCPDGVAGGCWSRVTANGSLEPVGIGPGLALENILYQDAGEYRCVPPKKKSYEKWRSELNLSVKGDPVVYPPNATITAYTGQQLDLAVEFCANPIPVKTFWITNLLKLEPGKVSNEFTAHNLTDSSDVYCKKAMLTLKKVEPGHEGEYLFIVRSSRGLADGIIFLNVTHVSGYYSSIGNRLFHSLPLMLILCTIKLVDLIIINE